MNIFIQNFGELKMKLKSEKITNFTNNLDLNNRILKLKNKLLKERENNKIIYLINSFKKNGKFLIKIKHIVKKMKKKKFLIIQFLLKYNKLAILIHLI